MSKVTVGEYPNGSVRFIDGSYVYIPNDVSSSTDVTIYYPGAVGDLDRADMKTASNYINSLLNEEGFDKIIILSDPDGRNMFSSSYPDKTTQDNMGIISSIEEQYNVTLNRVNTMGSSAGDKCALYNFAELCRQGKDSGYCVITGASTINHDQTEGQPYASGPNRAFLTDADYEAIKGKTVFIFESSKGEKYSYVKQLLAHDVDVVLVECKHAGHDALSYNPLQDNIFDLLDGNPSTFLESDNYTFKRCTDIKHNTWEIIPDEELQGTVNDEEIDVEGLLNKKTVSLAELYAVDDFEIQETTPEVLDKYSGLKDLESMVNIYTPTGTHITLASNMFYVSSSMSDLRSQIKQSNFLNAKNIRI